VYQNVDSNVILIIHEIIVVVKKHDQLRTVQGEDYNPTTVQMEIFPLVIMIELVILLDETIIIKKNMTHQKRKTK
jgi:hypothetical protein